MDFFEGTVNVNSYLKFICENLKELMISDVPVSLKREMIFMHDEIPARFTVTVA